MPPTRLFGLINPLPVRRHCGEGLVNERTLFKNSVMYSYIDSAMTRTSSL